MKVQKRGEENRSPSLTELCKMEQNTVPMMLINYHSKYKNYSLLELVAFDTSLLKVVNQNHFKMKKWKRQSSCTWQNSVDIVLFNK